MAEPARTNAGYSALKGQSAYWRMFIGNTVSRFGDSVDAIAYAWLVYALTGSASWSAIVVGVNMLPSVLLAPLIAPLAERMNQKGVIIGCNLGRALLVGITAALYLLGLLQPWMLLVNTFLTSTLEAFEQPVWFAIYPRIVPKECYTPAKALSQTASQVAQLVGTAASGFLLAVLGVGGALLIDGATFVFDAFMVSTIRLGEKEGAEKEPLTVRQYFADLKSGFLQLKTLPVVLLICVFAAILNLLLLPTSTLGAAYVALLGKGPELLSIINGVLMVGMLLGTVFYPYLAPKIERWKIVLWGSFALGLVYLGQALVPLLGSTWLVYGALTLCFLVMGLVVGMLNICVSVAFMEHVSSEYMARVGTVMSAMAVSLMPVGSFAIAGLTATISVPVFLLVFGLCIVMLTAVMTREKTLRAL